MTTVQPVLSTDLMFRLYYIPFHKLLDRII